MPRKLPDTIARWSPSVEQLDVIDWLASGYSQQACSRLSGIAVQTINDWIHNSSFSEAFRTMVDKRVAEFNAAKQAVHDQQVVMALQVIQDALSGELQREADIVISDDGKAIRANAAGKAPLRYEAAVELLRATFWKQIAGGHKQFGAP